MRKLPQSIARLTSIARRVLIYEFAYPAVPWGFSEGSVELGLSKYSKCRPTQELAGNRDIRRRRCRNQTHRTTELAVR